MSKIPSFFKIPKHKQFEYNPRHYDLGKEALLQQLDNVEKSDEGKVRSELLRNKFRSQRNNFRKSSNSQKQYIIRIVIIILIFAISFYFLLK